MDNYVIDTNCLIMIISSRTGYYHIWNDFLNGKFNLVISNEVMEEYVEIMGRNLSYEIAEYISYVILNSENVIKVSPTYNFNLIKADPDDNKFVDCAIAGNAKLIVTNDKHFDELERIQFPKVFHENIDKFMERMGYSKDN